MAILPFTLQCCEMVRHTLKILQHIKVVWVKTHDLQMLTASEVIGAKVTVLEKYSFVMF